MAKHKIQFELQQDEDGYPPSGVESVWAVHADKPGQYVIDNIPFFARQATLDDVVHAEPTANGLTFVRVVRPSQNSLIRVVVYAPDDIATVRSRLAELGCSTEAFSSRKLVAVNIPREADLAAVQAYLADLEARDLGSYEEPILRQ